MINLNTVKNCLKLLMVFLILSFIMVESVIFYNSTIEEQAEVDYLLILGAGVAGEKPLPLLQNRMDKALEFIATNPSVTVVVSGGQGPGEDISEAEAMKRYLLKSGIEKSRIIKEDNSTSTYENIKYTKALLKGISGDGEFKIMLVTSDFHMFRAKTLAKGQGFITYGTPADTPPQKLLYYYTREYLAVMKTFLLDVPLKTLPLSAKGWADSN